jgi:hypothetical protein
MPALCQLWPFDLSGIHRYAGMADRPLSQLLSAILFWNYRGGCKQNFAYYLTAVYPQNNLNNWKYRYERS